MRNNALDKSGHDLARANSELGEPRPQLAGAE